MIWTCCVALLAGSAYAKTDAETVFYGVADASAAVFLDARHIAVADDETIELTTYKVDMPQKPASRLVMGYLPIESKSPEADFEGAARVGDRVYWITSHGRNKDGKFRPNRYAFFATRIDAAKTAQAAPVLVPEGRICRTLAQQLVAFESPVRETIGRATQFGANLKKKERKKLAPKEQGLNIEGLCPYPAKGSLLIGLRNPLLETADGARKAIVVELLNPAQIIDKGAAAAFGKVLLWDLGERGIRGMEYAAKQGRFLVLAGPTDSETTFAMYAWDGDFESEPTPVHQWPGGDNFKPEAIAEAPDGRLWIFSDDGTLEIDIDLPTECLEGELLPNGKCPNKFLADPNRKTFRARVMQPD